MMIRMETDGAGRGIERTERGDWRTGKARTGYGEGRIRGRGRDNRMRGKGTDRIRRRDEFGDGEGTIG